MPRYTYWSSGRRNRRGNGSQPSTYYNRSGSFGSFGSSGNYTTYQPAGYNFNTWSNLFQPRRQQGVSGNFYDNRRTNYYTYTVSNQSNRDEGTARQDRAPEPDPEKTLTVKNVDLKIVSNSKAHHTSSYDKCDPYQGDPNLVVRRGQPFDISIQFNRAYDPASDDLKLIFQTSDQPRKSKGTYVDILLSDKDEDDKWGAKILSNKGTSLTVTVFTPPSLFIGKWALTIDVVEKDDDKSNVYSYIHPDPIYMIFNPWCKGDGVYLDNEEHRNEYVMNESGKIYNGTAKSISARPWHFGQFDSSILDVAFYLLDAGSLKWTVRGNPIAVSRKMTAMINSSDDEGVLTGNWSGNYSGGRSPLSWTGSPPILQRYWQNKEPVKFGQCWVFSGVTTTLMRTLGIPARSITNFASAHDTDGSITIDYHFNPMGEMDDDLNDDSIWNFHVWNEVWMSRPDLPIGFGGWQVVDATPQETSDGVYVCGPVSVQAIRQGEVNLPYDAPFVFAEVNADIVHWMPSWNGVMEPVGSSPNAVGKFISTKACNSWDREDVSLQYKAPEGSPEERAAVLKANLSCSSKTNAYSRKTEDVVFTINEDSQKTWVGGDFVVGLRMKNESSKPRTVGGRIVVKTMFYTGVTGEKIKSEVLSDIPLIIKPGKELYHEVKVTPEDYLEKLKDCCMIDVSFICKVNETLQVFTKKEQYRLRKPHLTIKAPKDVEVGKQFNVDVSFVNPIPRMLTECVVEVDGLSKDISFPQGNVGAKGTFSATIPVTAHKKGAKELILIFASKQLEDINGSHSIFVRA